MPTDYNKYAKTFAQSRRNMKWAELEYFFSKIGKNENILDVACGSGRLLEQYKNYFWNPPHRYLGIDISVLLIWEAKNNFPEQNFEIWDMRNLSRKTWNKKYDIIFCIAGLHHLESVAEREGALWEMYKALKQWGKIYMTNWSLHTWDNFEKYRSSQIWDSKNSFWSFDYTIKIGEFSRFYHSFSLQELEYLALQNELKIQENQIFETWRNIVSIFEK